MDSTVAGDPAITALIQSALDDYYNDGEALDKDKLPRFLAEARALRDRGIAAVTAVTDLFSTGDTRGRVVAAELVGRMSHDADHVMRDLCWSRLEAMLAAELAGRDNAAVIAGIAAAFQHLEDARALPSLLALAAHPCGDVRLAAASSIPMACEFTARDDAVACLTGLTGDSEADVRNWACFGLGQLDADGPEVRESLAARLNDEHAGTRCEALFALARTGDTRAYDKLAERLGAGEERKLEIKAAGEIADTRLRAALQRLAEAWKDDDDFEVFRPALEQAIARCDPRRRPAARAIEARLRTELGEQLAASGRTVRLRGEFPQTRLIIRANDGQTELLNSRIWDNTDPVDFNFEQEYASYLLTWGLHLAARR